MQPKAVCHASMRVSHRISFRHLSETARMNPADCFYARLRAKSMCLKQGSWASLPRAAVFCRPLALKGQWRLTALAAIISLLQHRRHFNGVGMPLNPELWTEKAKKSNTKPPKALFSCRELLMAWQYESFPQASTTTWPQMGVNGKDGSSGQTTEADSQPCQRAPDHWMSAWDTDGCCFVFYSFFCRKDTAAPLCCGTACTPAEGRQTDLLWQ